MSFHRNLPIHPAPCPLHFLASPYAALQGLNIISPRCRGGGRRHHMWNKGNHWPGRNRGLEGRHTIHPEANNVGKSRNAVEGLPGWALIVCQASLSWAWVDSGRAIKISRRFFTQDSKHASGRDIHSNTLRWLCRCTVPHNTLRGTEGVGQGA